MRFQVVEHQVNSWRFSVQACKKLSDEGGKVFISFSISDWDDSVPTLGLDRYERIGGTVAYALIGILGWAVGRHDQSHAAVKDML